MRYPLLPIGFLLAIAPAAVADENLNCGAYAGFAVAQQEQNVAQGCGFSGGQWSADFQGHFAWCASPDVAMADLVTEDNARKAALAECASRAERAQEACIGYAEAAVVAHAMAEASQCGLSGGAWSADFAGHFRWCVGVDEGARGAATAARDNQLTGCLAARASIREAECAGYAAASILQNEDNIRRNCGFTGGRWSNDGAGHFNWCMGADRAAADAEAAIRNEALAQGCVVTRCWTETRARVGIPPWEVKRVCRSQ